MPTAVAPKSKPTILERAQMRALEKYIQAVRNGWLFRAAFWRGGYLRPGWPEKQLSPHENSPLKIGSTWFETHISAFPGLNAQFPA